MINLTSHSIYEFSNVPRKQTSKYFDRIDKKKKRLKWAGAEHSTFKNSEKREVGGVDTNLRIIES